MIALESLDRQIADVQAELKHPTTSIEEARGAQTVVGSPSVRENGDRRWHMAEAWRAIDESKPGNMRQPLTNVTVAIWCKSYSDQFGNSQRSTVTDGWSCGKGTVWSEWQGNKRWWKTQQLNTACMFEMWKHGAHVRKLSPL